MFVKDFIDELLSDNARGLKRSEIREILKLVNQPGVISLAGGLPYPGLFPVEEVKDILITVMEREGATALQYGRTEGDERLIDFLVNWMHATEKVKVNAENIMIVSGAQQALDLVGKIFLNAGDPIIVGLPSYLGALQAFNSHRAKFIGVPVDNDGMDVNRVEEALKSYQGKKERIKFIYTVPDFQNPTGVTMTAERRQTLVALAEKYETVIIEDSPYRDLRFDGESVPMLASYDTKGLAFSLHTFSKIFAPGTRLGWITANRAIMEKLVMAKQSADLCSTPFTQAMVYEFCARGLLKPHIDKICNFYRKKRDVMIKALEETMPRDAGIEWTHPQGGLFLWLSLPKHIDAVEIFPKAIEKKVAYVIGSAFHFDGSGRNTMRLNFSYPSEEQIYEGISRIAALVKEEL